ncbi:bifunctional 4-hydroxy-2-oxoglutarate aldolase/2-dehydro-3-deoxy-phosphogluconate aldolase [Bacillus shivajii]|uniref:bifunctional 4-hydroxy-2-oxoglutarate aldolase/2-dehydro-3-deoxy-phosphogluconate aldolase n=1 Tax=Bacillus shivajii TaxID=1983719 RepID=UPI001CF93666|nr:bifunctional 4-hydroxy-2-oxoglutarate aldolase/2-dehydro-3-deoxy-phosphogluconate aldolase [Bacillus shivajii]UCZ52890.1 bifunctional 4-hydroxy-2-oxoglutarate aldolase/2-dehydro-3-deoxy-phosphogluconate aldolase [Bacillus shivajii]
MLNQLGEKPIIPILRGLSIEDSLFTVDCLVESGFNVIEISLNQDNSLDVLDEVTNRYNNDLLIGAGTVLNEPLAKEALRRGAQFFLSPHLSEEVFSVSKEKDVPYIPGAFTPTEIQTAIEMGAEIVKVFPIRMLGHKYISDILASMNHAKLLPVGGVSEENIQNIFSSGAFGVGIGSSLTKNEWIYNRDRDKLVDYGKDLLEKSLKAKEGS